MELREYWRVFRRRFWIPLVLVIIAALSTGAVTYLAAPSYVATATVLARGNGALSFPEVAVLEPLVPLAFALSFEAAVVSLPLPLALPPLLLVPARFWLQPIATASAAAIKTKRILCIRSPIRSI